MGKKSEMTEEEKKKREILNLAHTINVYEKEFLPESRAILDASQTKIDFLNGIILGLVLGIFGNLIAQYFYLVIHTNIV